MGLCSDFQFGGQMWRALPQGALFWPARRALIVADLHLEKASAYAVGGQMLPPYDSMATLAALEAAMDAAGACEVWCLGDSLHDPGAPARMTQPVTKRLAALTARCDWIWITGNHDPLPAPELGGTVREEALVSGILLRHEASAQETGPELSGHFHPKWRLATRGRTVSRRCFVLGRTRLILPAFGALAGGLDANAPVIKALLGGSAEALIPLRDRLLRFPLAA